MCVCLDLQTSFAVNKTNSNDDVMTRARSRSRSRGVGVGGRGYLVGIVIVIDMSLLLIGAEYKTEQYSLCDCVCMVPAIAVSRHIAVGVGVVGRGMRGGMPTATLRPPEPEVDASRVLDMDGYFVTCTPPTIHHRSSLILGLGAITEHASITDIFLR